MIKYLEALFFLLIFQFGISQGHNTCDGARYIDEIFSEVTITSDIKFGEGFTFTNVFQELYLDVYEPTGDLAATRPVVILAFGGSFLTGAKEDIDWLCQQYARRGFVAVSIDYRLFDGPLFPIPGAAEMQVVVIKAVSDMKAAIRYMREDAATSNDFRIDPNLVFLGGISAGAICASQTATIDETDFFSNELLEIIEANGGFEGNSSNNNQYSTEVSGVINFSGGLDDAYIIDANDPPFFSMHDEFDPVVPYTTGFATILGQEIIEINGSKAIKEITDSLDIHHRIITIEDSNIHVSYFPFIGTSPYQQIAFDKSSLFMHDIVCDLPLDQDPVDHKEYNFEISPNPSNGRVFIKLDKALKEAKVSILNLLGESLGNYSLVNENNELDLSPLNPGNYIAKIENENYQKSVIIILVE